MDLFMSALHRFRTLQDRKYLLPINRLKRTLAVHDIANTINLQVSNLEGEVQNLKG